MITVHLLNPQIEFLNLLVLVLYLVLEVALFNKDALKTGILPFELGMMLNVADTGL